MKKHNEERETKDIIINGYIYTLIKGRCENGISNNSSPPCFMGYENWALHSIVKMKRKVKRKMRRTK